MSELFIEPFLAFGFMRRALAGVIALSACGAPLGVLLMLRRMALTGDGMSHAILPGSALAFAVSGLALWPLTLGGFLAGLVVALAAGALSRFTALKEDASLASFYLLSLALGVVIVSTRGSNVDLMHFLFGSILALDDPTLVLIAAISTLTMIVLALLWRPLVLDGVDGGFLRTVSRSGTPTYMVFMALLVANLVASFLALGTLLAVGFLVLPAVIARFWARDLNVMVLIAVLSAIVCGVTGLLLSYHLALPTGPAIVLTLGMAFLASVLFGPVEGVLAQLRPGPHKAG